MSRRGGRRGSKDLPDEEEEAVADSSLHAPDEPATDSGLRSAADAESADGAQLREPRSSTVAESLEQLRTGGTRTSSTPVDVTGGVAGALEPPVRPSLPQEDLALGALAIEDGQDDRLALQDRPPVDGRALAVLSQELAERAPSKESMTSSEQRYNLQERRRRAAELEDELGDDELEDNVDDGSETPAPAELEDEDGEEKEEYSSDDDDFDGRNSMYAWQREAKPLFDPETDLDDEADDGNATGRVPVGDMEIDAEDGLLQINRKSMLSFLCFAVLWVFSAAALMLALTWHYVWVEVQQQNLLAAQTAVEHGSLHASEVLLPATTVMKSLDLGFREGILTSLQEDAAFGYDGLGKVLEPFFKALPELREVEIGDSPERPGYFTSGSVLARRLPNSSGIEIMSDRGDCVHIGSGRGCNLESHRANASDWYNERRWGYSPDWSALPMPVGWSGPVFARNSPHEAVCDDLCWSPTYSLTSRIAGMTDPDFKPTNITFESYRSVPARVGMEAAVFVEVLKQVAKLCRGEAFICTSTGAVVAAVEMADTQVAEPETGDIGMVDAWDFPREWASLLDEDWVAEGMGTSKLTGDGMYLVSTWKMESPHLQTEALKDGLRFVVAIPTKAYADSVLQSLRYWFIAASALPVAFVAVAVVCNIYLRFLRKGKKQLKDMTVEELQEITKQKKAAIAMRRKLKNDEAARHRQANGTNRQGSTNRMTSFLKRSTTSLGFGSSSGSGSPVYGSTGSKASRMLSTIRNLGRSRTTLALPD